MTEERIKELIQGFHLGWTSKHFKDTEALIRTVAAEAREGGIDALWEVLIKQMRTERKPLEDWQINEEATRLKEKGK